jgi:hypothetical protein
MLENVEETFDREEITDILRRIILENRSFLSISMFVEGLFKSIKNATQEAEALKFSICILRLLDLFITYADTKF